MHRRILFVAPVLVTLGAGGALAAQVKSSAPGGTPGGADATDRLVRIADASDGAGLGGIFNSGNTHTGGAAWVDYNADLLPDLFVTGGGGLPHRLFRNEGDGTFTDVTTLLPKPDLALEESGVKFADIDNDGDYDIFVGVDNPSTLVTTQPVNPSVGGPNLLYVNNGDGTFTESAALNGVLNPAGRRTSCAGFADYDNDGFVDLYLGGWTMYELPLGVHSDFGYLLKNDGDGTFTDVTASLGVDNYGLDALVLLWFDIDFDRYPDLYIGNVAHINSPPLFVPIDSFYRNGAGASFTDQVSTYPYLGDDAYANMGMDVGDIDNDGDWDLYITDIFSDPPVPQGNVLYRTTDAQNAVLSDNAAGIGSVSADSSWPCNYVDFDHDGWVDLWVGGNHDDDVSFLYLNDQTGRFAPTNQPLLQGMEARGGASADYDGDGDVDFVVTKYEQDLQLFRNDTPGNGNWIEFKLYGTATNRGAIGTVVKVSANGVTQMRRVTGGDSAHSQSDSILHFGVADADQVQVTVEWPSGKDQVFPLVDANALVLVDEDAGLLAPSVTDGGSDWSAASGTLVVRLRSNYGGRADLAVEGLGDLRYDAATRTHVGVFPGLDAKPRALSVVDAGGGAWRVALPPQAPEPANPG